MRVERNGRSSIPAERMGMCDFCDGPTRARETAHLKVTMTTDPFRRDARPASLPTRRLSLVDPPISVWAGLDALAEREGAPIAAQYELQCDRRRAIVCNGWGRTQPCVENDGMRSLHHLRARW